MNFHILYFYLLNIHSQGLYDEVNRNEVKLNNLNNTGEFLISQSTNCNQLKDTLDRVNQNWDITMNKMNSRKLGYVYCCIVCLLISKSVESIGLCLVSFIISKLIK